MKKKIISILLVACFGIGIFGVAHFSANDSLADTPFDYEQLGSEASAISDNDTFKVLFNENGITITRADLEKKILDYQLKEESYSEDEIIEAALKDLITKKTLVKTAKENGYTVSEEEFEEFRQYTKDTFELIEDDDEAKAYFKGYGGIDKYFEDMKDAICDGLIMNKYLDDLASEYAEENHLDKMSSEFYNLWEAQTEEIMNSVYQSANISDEKMTDLTSQCEKALDLADK